MPRTPPPPPPTRLRQALTRVARDAAYRAHVIEDGHAAQVEAQLPDADGLSLPCLCKPYGEEELAAAIDGLMQGRSWTA